MGRTRVHEGSRSALPRQCGHPHHGQLLERTVASTHDIGHQVVSTSGRNRVRASKAPSKVSIRVFGNATQPELQRQAELRANLAAAVQIYSLERSLADIGSYAKLDGLSTQLTCQRKTFKIATRNKSVGVGGGQGHGQAVGF